MKIQIKIDMKSRSFNYNFCFRKKESLEKKPKQIQYNWLMYISIILEQQVEYIFGILTRIL